MPSLAPQQRIGYDAWEHKGGFVYILLPQFAEKLKQAGAELGQAQVKLDDVVVIVVKAIVEVEVQLLMRVAYCPKVVMLMKLSRAQMLLRTP